MCLSLASPPNSILAHFDVRTTLSKKFNGRNRGRCRMTRSSNGATQPPDHRSGLRLTGVTRRAPMHSDLKVSATAVDDKSCQGNEKYNFSGDRPPVIFAAPWVGPPAVVARPTSAFKISMYHR